MDIYICGTLTTTELHTFETKEQAHGVCMFVSFVSVVLVLFLLPVSFVSNSRKPLSFFMNFVENQVPVLLCFCARTHASAQDRSQVKFDE